MLNKHKRTLIVFAALIALLSSHGLAFAEVTDEQLEQKRREVEMDRLDRLQREYNQPPAGSDCCKQDTPERPSQRDAPEPSAGADD